MRYAAGAMVGWYGAQVPAHRQAGAEALPQVQARQAVLALKSRLELFDLRRAFAIQAQHQNLRHIQIGRHRRRHVPAGGQGIGGAQHAQMGHGHGIAVALRRILQKAATRACSSPVDSPPPGRKASPCSEPGFDKGIIAMAGKNLVPRSALPRRPNSVPSAAHPRRLPQVPAPRRLAGAQQGAGIDARMSEGQAQAATSWPDPPR